METCCDSQVPVVCVNFETRLNELNGYHSKLRTGVDHVRNIFNDLTRVCFRFVTFSYS